MRRAIRINKSDGTFEDLELSKVTAIKDPKKEMSVMIHLDQLPDQTWRLTYNTGHIPNFTSIKNLEIIRED